MTTSQWNLIAKVCGGIAMMCAAQVFADGVSSDLTALQSRAHTDPKAFDRADQFCTGKTIGAACAVSGTPFEGGGKGICTQQVNEADHSLDAVCTLKSPIALDRGVPDGAYQADAAQCELALHDPQVAHALEMAHGMCRPVRPVPDRFCAGKEVGDSCIVDYSVNGAGAEQEQGHCAFQTEQYPDDQLGRPQLTRQVLQCQADHPVQRSFSKPSAAANRFGF